MLNNSTDIYCVKKVLTKQLCKRVRILILNVNYALFFLYIYIIISAITLIEHRIVRNMHNVVYTFLNDKQSV